MGATANSGASSGAPWFVGGLTYFHFEHWLWHRATLRSNRAIKPLTSMLYQESGLTQRFSLFGRSSSEPEELPSCHSDIAVSDKDSSEDIYTEVHFTPFYWFKSRTWQRKSNRACAKVTWKPLEAWETTNMAANLAMEKSAFRTTFTRTIKLCNLLLKWLLGLNLSHCAFC